MSSATRADFLKGMGDGELLSRWFAKTFTLLSNSHGAFIFYDT